MPNPDWGEILTLLIKYLQEFHIGITQSDRLTLCYSQDVFDEL